MNIKELMHTSLMKSAKLIAGKEGVYNDVTGCVQDQYADYEGKIMPGMLFLCVEDKEKILSAETLEAFVRMKGSIPNFV